MPTSVATHATLLIKAAAAKPFFSPRPAARIPAPSPHPPPPPAGRRLPNTAAALAAAARRFRWPSAAASARGLCAPPHSGGEGMGSDAGAGARKRRDSAVNGLAKDVPPVNGMMMPKEEPATAPPRLLTLPTVLTIGRVAAVPLLISSKLIRFIFFNFYPVSLLLRVGS
jgi:CDP-diacylglycerol---glycerol-3-phosphate 3-phosphatidyltransferase